MKTYILTTLFVTGLLMGCAQPPKDTERKITARDLSVTPAVSYSDLFLDSITIEKFISGQKYTDSIGNKLRNFYNSRNYECAWFFKEGIADYAATFYEMYNDYIGYSGDSTLYNSGLQLLYDSIKSGNLKTADSLTIKTELLLTVQFFRYATKAYQGNSQLNTKELDWFIPRKKINPVELLDTMLANKGKNLSALEPVNQQYNLLKEKLIKYYEIEKQGGWPVIKADKKLYKLNDTSNALTVIKKRLFLTGDLS
ncbi:MAG: hypothetical protein RIS73_871, partial [Bacteroidota bacterium]